MITTKLLIFLAALPFLKAETNEENCYKNRPFAHQTIMTFCSNPHILVPTVWAAEGINEGVKARIDAHCTPQEHVPPELCREQWFEMCAKKEPQRHFGTNKCQTWHLTKTGGIED